MGQEDAEILMEHLPKSPWDQMATKDDVKASELRILAERGSTGTGGPGRLGAAGVGAPAFIERRMLDVCAGPCEMLSTPAAASFGLLVLDVDHLVVGLGVLVFAGGDVDGCG